MDLHQLPALNAVLNTLAAVWLLIGRGLIRRGRVGAHRIAMSGALVTSAIFLISYLIYHARTGSTPFRSGGWIRPVYFTILVSHTILAAVILPLILVTLTRALRKRFPAHRRLARLTWPLWMYVSVTGVAIYLLLYRLDPYLLARSGS